MMRLINWLTIQYINLFNATLRVEASGFMAAILTNPKPLINHYNKWWKPFKKHHIIADCQCLKDVIPMYGDVGNKTHVVKTIIYVRLDKTRLLERMFEHSTNNKSSFIDGYMGLVIAENIVTGNDDILTYADVQRKISFANVSFSIPKKPKTHTN